MYCDRRGNNDCTGKAFYRSLEDEDSNSDAASSENPNTVMNANTNGLANMKKSNLILVESSEKCSFNGKLEDKLFCNLYHECQNGVDHVFACENQLTFNPLSELCDYPINVACMNKQIYRKVEGQSVAMAQKNQEYSSTSASAPTSSSTTTTATRMTTPKIVLNQNLNFNENINKNQNAGKQFFLFLCNYWNLDQVRYFTIFDWF